MTLDLKSLWILFLTLPLCFFTHALVLRLPGLRTLPRQASVFPAVIFAGFFTLSWVIYREPFSLGKLLYSFFICVALSHIYFHIFNMGETARRIRILVALKLGQTMETYDPQAAIEVRLERLIATGQVGYEGGCLTPKSSPLMYAALLILAYERLLYGGDRLEEDPPKIGVPTKRQGVAWHPQTFR